jgi:hypothetical protein
MNQLHTLLSQLADWLEHTKQAQPVINCLMGRLPELAAEGAMPLPEASLVIIALWCDQHGTEALTVSTEYKQGMASLKQALKQLRQTATEDRQQAKVAHARRKCQELLQLGTAGQLHLIQSGALEQTAAMSYTGSRTLDAILRSMLVLPPYVTDLKALACEAERTVGTVVGSTASASIAKADDAEITPRITPRPPIQKAGPAVVGHRDTGDTEVAGAESSLAVQMHSVLSYERAKAFELVCTLAFMSGRSVAELLCTGEFRAAGSTERPNVLQFRAPTGQAAAAWHKVVLLCKATPFLSALGRLRASTQLPAHTSVSSINRSHCKTANTAAKALLGDKTAVFTDLRAAYVVHSFQKTQTAPATAVNLQAWAAQCLPLSRLPTAPLFLQKCMKFLRS